MRSVPIINGGAGSDEHPTQALLDMYTIERTFQFDHKENSPRSRYMEMRRKYSDLTLGPDNKTYAFCGDLGRGRTVRSLATVLGQYKNVTMCFIAPEDETLQLDPDLRDNLIGKGVNVHELDSLDATVNGKPVLEEADCLYMTRIQKEHDTPELAARYQQLDLSHYKLTLDRVSHMRHVIVN